jgi:hypothetical protein
MPAAAVLDNQRERRKGRKSRRVTPLSAETAGGATVVECPIHHKVSHHRGATGKVGLLSHLKRPHGLAILAIVVFGLAWLVWTFVVW